MTLRECILEKDAEGKPTGAVSFKRTLPVLFGLLLTALGLAIFVGIWATEGEGAVQWADYRGLMDWLKALFFGTLAPYASEKLGKIGQKSGG